MGTVGPMSFESIASRYDIKTTSLKLDAVRELEIVCIRDLNALVDRMTEEDFGEDERLPYWAHLWPSAIELAAFLPTLTEPLGPTLELGAGLGIASVVAAQLGAEVTASDYEPDALAFARENAKRNGVQIETRLLDFRTVGGEERFSTVLGSDLVYEERNAEPLARALASLLAEGGRAFLADPGRPHLRTFTDLLPGLGLIARPATKRADHFILRIEHAASRDFP